MTDLQTRIREFLATAYSPDNPLTARDKLDQAVGLLKEAGDCIDKLLVKAINNEGMADCMAMVYSDLKRAGIVSDSVPPMMLTEAILGYIHKKSTKDHFVDANKMIQPVAWRHWHPVEQNWMYGLSPVCDKCEPLYLAQ